MIWIWLAAVLGTLALLLVALRATSRADRAVAAARRAGPTTGALRAATAGTDLAVGTTAGARADLEARTPLPEP